MTQSNLKNTFYTFSSQKRRGVAEVISSLLLVAITVVGAVILTSFMDETFVAGSLGASSSSDDLIKSVKLRAFDSRDGGDLLNLQNLNNTSPIDQKLCRSSCSANPNTSPTLGGSEFIVIQIENSGVNPLYLHNVYLDGVNHSWDSTTSGIALDPSGSISNGDYPGDGSFSIFPVNCNIGNGCDETDPTKFQQFEENLIQNGQTANLLVKLDTENTDIPLSKTILTHFNVGDNQLSETLIESGGAQ